jgi:hypothetical protein
MYEAGLIEIENEIEISSSELSLMIAMLPYFELFCSIVFFKSSGFAAVAPFTHCSLHTPGELAEGAKICYRPPEARLFWLGAGRGSRGLCTRFAECKFTELPVATYFGIVGPTDLLTSGWDPLPTDQLDAARH